MISEQTAYEAWVAMLRFVRDNGTVYKDVRGRQCYEVNNLQVQVCDVTHQLTLPIEHLQHIDSWIYPSLQEIAEVVLQKGDFYGYSYGARLFEFNGHINQINDFVIPLLKRDPHSRRAIITLFDPSKDSSAYAQDVPSVIALDFKIRDQKVHMTAFIRSNDMFIGWPANVYQFAVLQEYVAARLDRQQGPITTFSTSAHIFQEHFELIDKLLR